MGSPSGGHPFAETTFTVGMSDVSGGGRTGWGPIPAETGSFADGAHAVTLNAVAATITPRRTPPSEIIAPRQRVVLASVWNSFERLAQP
jgi:hypothetical protein